MKIQEQLDKIQDDIKNCEVKETHYENEKNMLFSQKTKEINGLRNKNDVEDEISTIRREIMNNETLFKDIDAILTLLMKKLKLLKLTMMKVLKKNMKIMKKIEKNI